MTTLKEKYLALIKEYVRQFSAITNLDFEYWIGPVDGQCGAFADMTYTAEEIMFVVDNIDELAAKYGSREAVGQEVVDWFNYITDDGTPQQLQSVNLFAWLRGLSDDDTRKKIIKDSETRVATDREKLYDLQEAFSEILQSSVDMNRSVQRHDTDPSLSWCSLYDRIQAIARKINDKYNK